MSQSEEKPEAQKEEVKTEKNIPKTISYGWIPKEKRISQKEELDDLGSIDDHPLKEISQKKDEKKEINLDDPLKKEKKDTVKYSQRVNYRVNDRENDEILNWKWSKSFILERYRTNKQLPIYSSILFGAVDQENISFENKIKQRLAVLGTEGNKRVITQKKYITFLEELNDELKKAWNEDNDRVNSLKIVIKCTKMLSKTLVPEFYPSMFVLVVEIMDTFGSLVYNRIKEKSIIKDRYTNKIVFRLPKEFTTFQVPPRAKEICNNWFYKISSIRELIARIYVEMVIIQSRKYLYSSYDSQMHEELTRLTLAIRGIGDPLIGNYCRFFLAKKGSEVLPNEKGYLKILYNDFFIGLKEQLKDDHYLQYLNSVSMNIDEFKNLFLPPGQWITECLGKNGDEKLYKEMLSTYLSSGLDIPYILDSIIKSFPAHIIAKDAYNLINLINESSETIYRKYHLFRSLGKKFALHPPIEKRKLDVLNIIWKIVTKFENLDEYLLVAEVFIEYVCNGHTLREVNILLKDIHKHVIPKKNIVSKSKKLEILLQNVLLAILQNASGADIVSIFNMKFFLPLFDVLKSDIRIEVSKGILRVLKKSKTKIKPNPIVLNSLFDLCKIVHDSVNYLSGEEEWNECESLVHCFVKNIDLSESFEKEIDFYLECRKNFYYFDKVLEEIIENSLQILLKMSKLEQQTFMKSVQSFIHITIPSISDILKRMKFYLLAAEVCFICDMVPQAEDLIKRCLFIIKDLSQFRKDHNNAIVSNEEELVNFVANISSLLIAVTGHPKFGPFFLLKGLLNSISLFQWQPKSSNKIRAYLATLYAISNIYYGTAHYSYEHLIIQNSDLFQDSKIKEEALSISNTVINRIVHSIEELQQNLGDDVSAVKELQSVMVEVLNFLFFGTKKLTKELLKVIIDSYTFVKNASNDSTNQMFLKNTLNKLKKTNKNLYDRLINY